MLSSAFDLTALDPRRLKVYFRGEEQFIYVQGESDGKFNSGDFLEFYGNPNSAHLDSLLYHDIKYVPNPFQPLFNDTMYAFITDGGGINGKRFQLESDTTISAYPAGQYVYTEKVRAGRDAYHTADQYDEFTSDPRYTQTEGYGAYRVKGGFDYMAFVGTPVYSATPLPVHLTVAYTGASRALGTLYDHQIQVAYQDNGGNTNILSDTLLAGFVPVRQQFTLSSGNLSNTSDFSVTSVANPSFSAFDNQTYVHYIHLEYPSRLVLNGPSFLRFHVDNHPSAAKTAYSFYGLGMNGGTGAALYDLTDGRRITTVVNNGFVHALIPNGSGRRRFFLVSDSLSQKVKKLTPAGENGFMPGYMPSGGTPYVIIYNGLLSSSAQQYKAYRQSPAGGGYQVVLANIEHLYEQYSHGVRKHPAAIRSFLQHLYDSLAVKPAYVLLLGAATTPVVYLASHPSNLVPTMGRPNSDNLLAAGLDTPGQYPFHPTIPIGRVAAINDGEVITYLDKVKSFEAAGHPEWKKNVLHFVGGDSESLSTLLGNFMNGYEALIEDTLYGAQVRTFRKNSSQPIQVVVSDSIKEMVNEGAGLLTFFGHGNPYGFDQAIDEPELYSNKDKYPFLFANSCYSGEIHDPGAITVSKRFVFAKDKGSVGFLATTSLGFIYALNDYARHFYEALSHSKYNQGIGDVIREAAFRNSFSGKLEISFVGLDMTLHGDPAVVISAGDSPDFTISDNDIGFDLASVQDSIGVKIAYRNIGMALPDTITISLERTFPDGDTSRNYYEVPAAFFRDTVEVFIPVEGSKGSGLNYFRVKVDQLNDVAELNEGNNQTSGGVELFIPGNDVLPVYPFQFAVVPKTASVTLKASTINAYAATASYRFELDTCNRFVSPVASTVITAPGGVLEWNVAIPYKDSTVFFWRVTRDSAGALDRISWKESSFQVLADKRGWAQAHFHQFRDNGSQLTTYKEALRRFVFENRINTVNARAGTHPYLPEVQQTYFFNNNRMDSWSCTFNGWNFAVFDSISGEPLKALNPTWPGHGSGPSGNCVCDKGLPYHYVFYFGKTSECTAPSQDLNWKSKVETFLNSVAPNNYVLGYTTGNPAGNAEMSTYSESLYQAFESIGSGSIRTTPDTVSMVIFGKKGLLPGEARERVGASRRDILFTQDSIRTKWNTGYIVSPRIGPSYEWKSLHWQVASLDATAGDTTFVKLVGIRDDGTMDTLATYTENNTDITGLSSVIDAKIYPFMKLVAYMRDLTHRTSPQLKRWHVLFDEAPECALNPPRLAGAARDSLQEGEKVAFHFPIENIGAEAFDDSLAVTYWIEDAQREMIPLAEKRKSAPFKSGQILIDTVLIDSYQLQGNNALWISVNPPGHPRYQHEQHYFNNVARVPFLVTGDRKNPLLDVTFDGRRILNGDIVSARPVILVTLKDENQFLALNDTSAFTIMLRSPGQNTPQKLSFARDLQFTPARLPKNSAKILFTPELHADGKYTLVAQARDRSNNLSGAGDLSIDFEVYNKPTVTSVLNYPNPFTTSTRFVFTLTGSEIPEVFTIQIMTITGKVVREITRAELGTIRIGRNITEYAWDGRDQFGDRLGNGVYLYRVRTKLHGNNIEKQASGADKFFTKEYGKMVLMR